MKSSDAAVHPFASDGGVTGPALECRDPFAALDDLMQVVEALCPIWPEREIFSGDADFKL